MATILCNNFIIMIKIKMSSIGRAPTYFKVEIGRQVLIVSTLKYDVTEIISFIYC